MSEMGCCIIKLSKTKTKSKLWLKSQYYTDVHDNYQQNKEIMTLPFHCFVRTLKANVPFLF